MKKMYLGDGNYLFLLAATLSRLFSRPENVVGISCRQQEGEGGGSKNQRPQGKKKTNKQTMDAI